MPQCAGYFIRFAVTVSVLASGLSTALAQPSAALACGKLENAYGPFDYTNPSDREKKLPIVEKFHFTQSVETLARGNTGSLVHDLDYTLRAFPNHHRALYAMLRYQLKNKGPAGAGYTMECYFDRALRLTPKDGEIYVLYGIYLHRKGDYKGALEKYKKAAELLPDSGDLHYNLGLLYIDTKKYKLAKQEADKAYASHYPLPGLKIKLRRLGFYK